MKNYHRYFLYLSLGFLLLALYKADYLKIPEIHSKLSICLSFFLLFLGSYVGEFLAWEAILKRSFHTVEKRLCYAGVGLSMFGKYIPGKVWMIVGRAAYISERTDYSLGRLSLISLNAQFIVLWLGLALGSIGLFTLGKLQSLGFATLLLWFGLTVVLFSPIVRHVLEHTLKKVTRRNISIPSFNATFTLMNLHWYLLSWLLWSAAFWLLVQGLTTESVRPTVGLAFPLAGTLGIMALVSPGGLGLREGILVGYLNLAGLSLESATTISVASRLWFLFAELFIFLIGFLAHRSGKKTPSQPRSPILK